MAFITAVRNRLVLDFSWKKVRCREYLRLPATREGRAEARRIKKQIEGEIVARTFDYAKWFPKSAKRELFAPTREAAAAPAFAALAREWLENKKAWFAPATYYDRKRIIEGKLIPFFDAATAGSTSARLVSTIQLEDVERLVNAVKGHEGIHGRKLSNRRANIILDVLRQVLDRAVLRGWLTRNPARAVSKLRSSYIFPSRTGGPLNISNVRERVWKPALRRAGLRYRTMYQTRHTFATLALQSSEQIGWVSKQLGHTSDEMVIRHYAKFIPNLTRQDGSALAKVMQEQGLA